VLCHDGKAVRLSVDHKPNIPEERQRIEAAGGFVSETNRLNGVLAMSRGLGDAKLQPVLTAEPSISVTHLTPEDKFLIIACDGVWDIFPDQVSVQNVKAEAKPEDACVRIRDRVYSSGSTDNISIIVLHLQ